MSSIADETESGSYAGLLITAGSLFGLSHFFPAPIYFIPAAFGVFMTVIYGGNLLYKLVAALLLGVPLAGYLVGLGEPAPDPHDFVSTGPGVHAPAIDRSLHEPIRFPVGFEFYPVQELWTDTIHVYQSTAPANAKQARRAQVKVMTYYEDGLSSEWKVLRSQDDLLVFKDPDSTQGIAVHTSSGGSKHAAVVTLEIHSLYCDSDTHCA